jgi:hypothetical protein
VNIAAAAIAIAIGDVVLVGDLCARRQDRAELVANAGELGRGGDHRTRNGQGLVKNPSRSALEGGSSFRISATVGPGTTAPSSPIAPAAVAPVLVTAVAPVLVAALAPAPVAALDPGLAPWLPVL